MNLSINHELLDYESKSYLNEDNIIPLLTFYKINIF